MTDENLWKLVAVVGTLVGAWVGKLLERNNAERTEQRKLALDLLLRIEKFCDAINLRRKLLAPPEVPEYRDDPLVTAREEIVAHAQGVTNDVAFGHLETLDLVLWWLRDPVYPNEIRASHSVNAYPVKQAFRRVLGALLRGKVVPKNLPRDYVEIVKLAKTKEWQMTPDEE